MIFDEAKKFIIDEDAEVITETVVITAIRFKNSDDYSEQEHDNIIARLKAADVQFIDDGHVILLG